MGYSIYIGDTKMRRVEQYDGEPETITEYRRVIKGKTVYFQPHVEQMEVDDAPTFPNDEMTGKSNYRSPLYHAWTWTCEQSGLSTLFFNKSDGLMRGHPGYATLDTGHLIAVYWALERWKHDRQGAIPGFERSFLDAKGASDVGYDSILAHLIWLEWWIRHAVEHCEHAGIYNF